MEVLDKREERISQDLAGSLRFQSGAHAQPRRCLSWLLSARYNGAKPESLLRQPKPGQLANHLGREESHRATGQVRQNSGIRRPACAREQKGVLHVRQQSQGRGPVEGNAPAQTTVHE